MGSPPARRIHEDRRETPKIPEALERSTQRRAHERRESPRAWARIQFRDPTAERWHEGLASEVGLGGASWRTLHPCTGVRVEVRVHATKDQQPLTVTGRILRTCPVGSLTALHVQFEELPVRHELALAAFLQAQT